MRCQLDLRLTRSREKSGPLHLDFPLWVMKEDCFSVPCMSRTARSVRPGSAVHSLHPVGTLWDPDCYWWHKSIGRPPLFLPFFLRDERFGTDQYPTRCSFSTTQCMCVRVSACPIVCAYSSKKKTKKSCPVINKRVNTSHRQPCRGMGDQAHLASCASQLHSSAGARSIHSLGQELPWCSHLFLEALPPPLQFLSEYHRQPMEAKRWRIQVLQSQSEHHLPLQSACSSHLIDALIHGPLHSAQSMDSGWGRSQKLKAQKNHKENSPKRWETD